MIELLAGALAAAAALAYVLEPLVYRSAHREKTLTQLTPESQALVQAMRARLLDRCVRCDTPRELGFAFCSNCGAPLLTR